MRRRDFITLISSAAVAALPYVAHGQSTARPERKRLIGLIGGFSESEMRPLAAAFRERIAQLGWFDGRNITIEVRGSDGDMTRLDAHARDMVSANADLIVALGSPGLTAVSRHSKTVPVVFTMVADPVGQGLIASLAHPGGNATGLTNFEFGIGGKWLELLKQVDGRITSVTLIINPANSSNAQFVQPAVEAGKSMGLEVTPVPVRNKDEIERAINEAAKPSNGIVVFPDSLAVGHHAMIIELVERHRLPAAYPFRVFTANGGLMSYGLDYVAIYRQAADYADKILRGAKPADLPVEAPNKFELVINLKAAKALGLTVPASLLVAADEVIE